MSRPVGTADELERRRERAVRAVAGGEPRQTVAKVLGVHYKTVARWVREARTSGGVAAKTPYRPEPGLSDQAYYLGNTPRLRRLRSVYDPSAVFTLPQDHT